MAEVPGYKDGVDEGVARFEMKVTGVFGGDATKRQLTEAVYIEHAWGADQQSGRVAAGQTAMHRPQPVMRSHTGYQSVSHDVNTTTGGGAWDLARNSTNRQSVC